MNLFDVEHETPYYHIQIKPSTTDDCQAFHGPSWTRLIIPEDNDLREQLRTNGFRLPTDFAFGFENRILQYHPYCALWCARSGSQYANNIFLPLLSSQSCLSLVIAMAVSHNLCSNINIKKKEAKFHVTSIGLF
ncbi:hypothetical protein SNEBB_007850 [Seison nebaliae]|nr:hypothetical protein SNEBB_007850 [Seison nebaliae]